MIRAACTTMVAAALAAGCTPAEAGAADPVPASFYGVNGQSLFHQPQSMWAGELAAMAADGLSTVRRDADWATAEPAAPDPVTGRHTFVWWPFDVAMAEFARAGVSWYPILDYGTAWAGRVRGDDRSAPDPAAFSAYAAAFAARYGRGGRFWDEHPSLPYRPVTDYEIWNEPNHGLFWHGQTTAAEDYVDLYLAAREALHAVDPQAVAVAGALSSGAEGNGVPFVQRMAAHRPDAAGRIDAFSYHPYATDAVASAALVAVMRAAVDTAFGPGIPLHITEVGWSSMATLDADRGRYLGWLAAAMPASGCNVTRFFPHTWLTAERDYNDLEDWFGIHNPDGTAKPSETAYAAAVLGAERDGPRDDPAYGVCKPPPPPPVDPPVTTTIQAPPPPPPPPPVPRSPLLRATSQLRGRVLTVTVGSAAGVTAPRTVAATRGRTTRTLARVRDGVYRRTLPAAGTWRVAIRSTATATWKAQTLIRTIKVRVTPQRPVKPKRTRAR